MAIIDGLRPRPVRTIEEVKRATLQGKTAHQAKSIAHGPTTHSSEVLGAGPTCEYSRLSNWSRTSGTVMELVGYAEPVLFIDN